MAIQDFEDVGREVFRLYHDQAYSEAYELVVRESARFPDHAGRLMYWQACFACLLDHTSHGLKILQEAIALGHWYAPDQLRSDPDLKELQGMPEFEAIIAVCQERLARAQTEGKPQLRIYEPEPHGQSWPLMMLLHGHGIYAESFNASFTDWWLPALSDGWFLAVPQSSLMIGPNQYGWGDFEAAGSELQGHYAALGRQHPLDPDRFVIGGFSRGAMLASWLALTGALPAQGVIAVAPGGPYISQPELWNPIIETGQAEQARFCLIIGKQDTACYSGTCRLAEMLSAYGIACELEIQPELGHEFPPTFAQSLTRALAFIFQN